MTGPCCELLAHGTYFLRLRRRLQLDVSVRCWCGWCSDLLFISVICEIVSLGISTDLFIKHRQIFLWTAFSSTNELLHMNCQLQVSGLVSYTANRAAASYIKIKAIFPSGNSVNHPVIKLALVGLGLAAFTGNLLSPVQLAAVSSYFSKAICSSRNSGNHREIWQSSRRPEAIFSIKYHPVSKSVNKVDFFWYSNQWSPAPLCAAKG